MKDSRQDVKLITVDTESRFTWEDDGQKYSFPLEFKKRPRIGLKEDRLAKAIGIKKNLGLNVLDLTAGLGRDAFHLACLGAKVIALEKEAMIFKAISSQPLPEYINLKFLNEEATSYLRELSEKNLPDVIYFDPMFPEKKKTALPSKESRLLQKLAPLNSTEELVEILNLSLKKSKKRVVVKRPHYAGSVIESPHHVIEGKSVRYDVYMASHSPKDEI